MGKRSGQMAGKKARKGVGAKLVGLRRRPAFFPPPGTILEQDRTTPVTWCLSCRAGRHDLCDREEMRFCVCREEGHEEDL